MTGSSRWITGEKSREHVHKALRNTADAVVVGIGTILADDPSLTVRLRQTRNAHNPVRVIIDSRLRTPTTANACGAGTSVYAAESPEARARARAIMDTGAQTVFVAADENGRVDVTAAMRDLAARGFLSVLLEAGGELASSFYAARLVDTVLFFVAPKLVGGRDAPTPIGGSGLAHDMGDAVRTGALTVRRFGADVALFADILYDR